MDKINGNASIQIGFLIFVSKDCDMIELFWNKDILPEEYGSVEMEDLFFKTTKSTDSFVKEGTVVGEIYKYNKETSLLYGKVDVVSPTSGFVKYSVPSVYKFGYGYQYPINTPFCTVYSLEEARGEYDAYYQIFIDPFSKEKRLKWTSLFDASYIRNGFYKYGYELGVSFNCDVSPHLLLCIHKSKFKPSVNDTVSFLFVDNEVRTFIINKKPIKNDDEFIINIELTKADLDKMVNFTVDSLRFESKKALPFSFVFSSRNCVSLGQYFFRRFAQKFAEALNELGYIWPIERPKDGARTPGEPCYVYLMVDIANGYHKIGISNHPEYREGTLQSEKPTIELLCAKQFPSRTIAKAIESALHKTYEDKHLRGEWFQLDAKDIIDLMATLK